MRLGHIRHLCLGGILYSALRSTGQKLVKLARADATGYHTERISYRREHALTPISTLGRVASNVMCTTLCHSSPIASTRNIASSGSLAGGGDVASLDARRVLGVVKRLVRLFGYSAVDGYVSTR